jgi:gas vesicle protein
MFFKRNKDKRYKKFLTGMIIGGAIGSVVGSKMRKECDNDTNKKERFVGIKKILYALKTGKRKK